MASAAKLSKLLRRKERIEERVEVLRMDMDHARSPDARARISSEMATLIDDYGRVARKLNKLEGNTF